MKVKVKMNKYFDTEGKSYEFICLITILRNILHELMFSRLDGRLEEKVF